MQARNVASILSLEEHSALKLFSTWQQTLTIAPIVKKKLLKAGQFSFIAINIRIQDDLTIINIFMIIKFVPNVSKRLRQLTLLRVITISLKDPSFQD